MLYPIMEPYFAANKHCTLGFISSGSLDYNIAIYLDNLNDT